LSVEAFQVRLTWPLPPVALGFVGALGGVVSAVVLVCGLEGVGCVLPALSVAIV
jgi:hypothetical protein